MAYACAICGKTKAYGISQTHHRGVAGKRWRKRAQETKRLFKINLQKTKLMVDGEVSQVRLCTKCLKRIKKFGKIRNYSSISL